MKRTLFLATAALLLIAADNPKEEAAVRKAIDALNEAFVKKDKDALQKLMDEDHISITAYYGGAINKADQIKSAGDLKFADFKAGAMKFTWITKDVVLISYPLTQKATYKGKEVAPKAYASAVWVNRGGKWVEAAYQETPLSGK